MNWDAFHARFLELVNAKGLLTGLNWYLVLVFSLGLAIGSLPTVGENKGSSFLAALGVIGSIGAVVYHYGVINGIQIGF